MRKFNNNSTKISLVMLTCVGIFLGGCSDNFTSPSASTGNTIIQVAAGNDSLKAFVAALAKVGLDQNFNNNNGGQFTGFAPSNYAFVQYLRTAGISIGKVSATTAADAAITAINSIGYTPAVGTTISLTGVGPTGTKNFTGVLDYHFITSTISSDLIIGAQGFTTLNGARLSLSVVAGAAFPIQLNANVASSGGSAGANVITADLAASNGVLHIIDRVMPPVSVGNIWDKTLLNFVVNYTVTPIGATMFPSSAATTASITIARDNAGNFNVANALTNAVDGDFNLFTAALIRSNSITILNPNGAAILPDFTVFAPTDGALKAYFGKTLESDALTVINGMTPDALATLVNYHIISGRILTTDLTNGQAINTLSTDKAITINVAGSVFSIKDLNGTSADATITGANKLTNAGIIHGINNVLVSQ